MIWIKVKEYGAYKKSESEHEIKRVECEETKFEKLEDPSHFEVLTEKNFLEALSNFL